MAIVRTTTYTAVYTQSTLIELQIELMLRRSGIAASIREAAVRGIRNRWIENISLYWLNSANLLVAELSVDVNWSRNRLRLAAGRESDAPYPDWSSDVSADLSGDIASFLASLANKGFHVLPTIRYSPDVDADAANEDLGFKPAMSTRWTSGGTGTATTFSPRELDEFSISLRLEDMLPSDGPADIARGSESEDRPDNKAYANIPGYMTEDLRPAPPAELQVEIYLDSNDKREIARVFRVVNSLVELLGYEHPVVVGDFPGSIFRRAKAVSKDALTSKELRDRLIKVERAVELNYLDAKQAEVDGKEAEAVSKLVGALENVPEACVRLGSILLIKCCTGTGTVIVTRNLSQAELKALERFPEIQTRPNNVLAGLATAVASLESFDND